MIFPRLRLPGTSATDYAMGYFTAGNGTMEQASRQGCIYDGVSILWWRLVRHRVRRALMMEKKNELLM